MATFSPIEVKYDLISLSDSHFREPDSPNMLLFLDLAKMLLENPPRTLVLAGDIFDFCLGTASYFKRKYQTFGDALSALVKMGCRVVFLEGNHEFGMQAIGWDGVEVITDRDFFVTLKNGEAVKFCHGDLLHSHARYRAFRKVVKHRIPIALASLVPGSLLDRFALSQAHLSRASDRYRTLNHHGIITNASAWLHETPHKWGVFGHFHVPYFEPSTLDPKRFLLSVNSWEKPSFLAFSGDELYRAQYHDGRWVQSLAQQTHFLR